MNSEKKILRMVEVARMYYQQDIKQDDIAKKMNISRPLVSKILSEAKDMGIVNISINSPLDEQRLTESELCHKLGLKNVIIVERSENPGKTKRRIYQESGKLISQIIVARNINEAKKSKEFNIGIGWGHKVYDTIDMMTSIQSQIGCICSLIGNYQSSNKTYHSNEIVRKFSEKTEIKPEYIYAPAFFETYSEKEIVWEMESTKKLREIWSNLSLSIIGMRNYPSVPDFSTISRFGESLNKQGAVGEVVSYYYDIHGNIIKGDNDYTVHIPLEMLRSSERIIAIAGESTNANSVMGLVKARLATDIIIHRDLAEKLLKI